MEAQKSVNVHGHVQWQTLPGGLGQCVDCDSLGVDPVPDGTQTIALKLVMMPGTVGKLFLGSWIPS